MAVTGINTIWKQDIKLLVVMIFFWQVDINNWQVNIKIWQVDIIIWQVMAEICHHRQVNIQIWQVDIIIWQVDILTSDKSTILYEKTILGNLNMSTCQKVIWQVMTEICHHSIPIHLFITLHWYQKQQSSSIVVTCITIRYRKSTVLERLTVKINFNTAKKNAIFLYMVQGLFPNIQNIPVQILFLHIL